MDYKKFVREHNVLAHKICDVLVEASASSEEGELVMLWLAGLSLGKRQSPLDDGSSALGMLAVGWQVGAGDTDDD